MRVLIPLHGFVRWNGGLDFIRLLIAAMDSIQDADLELIFAVPVNSAPSQLLHYGIRRFRQLLAKNSGGSQAGTRGKLLLASLQMIENRPLVQCSDSAGGIVSAAQSCRSDVIFPTMLPLGNAAPPRLGYLFDFQHKYLQDLFSNRMRRKRDKHFEAMAKDVNGIVVNSKSVANDVVRFLGFPAARILALPFSPYALPHWFEESPEVATRRYGISGRYLLVCNHFWTHKDHKTALRAFALIRANTSFSDLQLVMTGDTIDHRDPGHYARLQDLAMELGLARSTHFLGLIPKHDQIALLRGCEALLQPTLFEGGPGGGSIYEAVGLGIPAVASDIPINLEIDRGQILYFKAGDAEDLAQTVLEVMATPTILQSREDLLENGNANLRRLGGVIYDFLDNPTSDAARIHR